MPSGITVDGLFLPRVSLPGLTDKIEEYNEDIRRIEHKLIALAAQSPTINADAEGNPIPWHDWVTAELNMLLTDYRDAAVNVYLASNALSTLRYAPQDVTDDHYTDSGLKWKQEHGYAGPAVEVPL